MTATPNATADRTRRYVLGGVVALLGLVTGAILLEVLGTILFALTVAYVLLPVQGWLVRRGLSEWVAAAAATLIGFASAVAVFSPILITLYFRVDQLMAIIEDLPREVPITAFEMTYTVDVAEVQAPALDVLSSAAVSFASALPVLAIKFALFVILLFAILLKGDAAGRAAIAPIPHEYRDVVYALAKRARETLYAIYVLQLATSVATLLIGYPLFWLLGYEAAFTLAIVAAILQFVPIIGPSLLILPIAIYHVAVGELAAAILVGVLGVGLVAWFPDVGVRPRLARRSAGLPGSLYFVGFTGGLFTLGAIGIVVGPLIVAVFVEAVDILADEVNGDATFSELVEADPEGPPGSRGTETTMTTPEDLPSEESGSHAADD
ncbi:AI-2E family transporter [Natronorubrum thiooxidans]|uniref:Predicted PurR-regulated permease PerM n=1 Tax=Natronorubrum thiooxidans TaxID=308853 RepID=A0A1N7EZK1_9EURY|nr:AI-2E family transporter [Natronorubrum thiooxidans]SIR93518.1 Predicted PurR-regulated permease PerM [Natronorubrum thiooxidans]